MSLFESELSSSLQSVIEACSVDVSLNREALLYTIVEYCYAILYCRMLSSMVLLQCFSLVVLWPSVSAAGTGDSG